RARPPPGSLLGAAAPRARTERSELPVRARVDEFRLRRDARLADAAPEAAALRPGGADRLLPRLQRGPLPARRGRRRGSRPPRRYSSSPALSRPPTITASAASRLIQIPIPRPASG